MKMNKRGGFTDLFLFMIFAVIIVFVSGIMIYLGGEVHDKLITDIGNNTFTNSNQTYADTINSTINPLNTAYRSLYWITFFIVGAMIISIFIGSYMVTTRPVMFIPYIILVLVAVIVSVGISNAYESVVTQETLSATFGGFIGTNYILSLLPLWITIIGFIGGIIMYVRFQIASQTIELGGYG